MAYNPVAEPPARPRRVAAASAVSSVLLSTGQTSLVSRHGGADLLAAFSAAGLTVKTAALLFAFLGDGVAAKVARSAAQESPAALCSRVRLYLARWGFRRYH